MWSSLILQNLNTSVMCILVFVSLLAFACSTGTAAVEVTTSLGAIRGSVLQSRLGAEYYAFRGIRYATPPVGALRFKNPEPVKAWKPAVFDATDDGPMCPQTTTNITDLSEDCLRLNVYTRDLTGCKPVVFYIHPGGFYGVSGQSKNFAGPQHLMDRDIVLVTINYRLGTFGFLATDTADAPGNAGLKDQVIALRWVQTHIKHFGGDPQSVTLLGYSAGSLSIGLHMLSPMSRGLFHRAIAMSASPLGQWSYSTNGLILAERQAKLLNCPVATTAALVSCLREKPMLDFANTTAMFEFGWNPILNWYPVIEQDFGQERYLTENPFKTVQRGDFHKVPLITGITEYEMLAASYYTLINDTTRKMFNEHFEQYAPVAFLYERETTRSKEISATLRSKYLKNVPLQFPESLIAFGEIFSDSVIGFEYHRFLQLMSQHTPVYTYLFTYKGRYSHFKPNDTVIGAVHHDELLYLLHVPVLTPLFKQTDPENEMIERITRMWTEFARKGDPNNATDEHLKQLNWALYSPERKPYLEIGDELVMKEGGIFPERFRLWDDLFPLPKF